MTARSIINESMRIGGRKVDADGVVSVHYPYTNEVIGTVPAGRPEHAAQAFAVAAAYKPKLSRYERQQRSVVGETVALSQLHRRPALARPRRLESPHQALYMPIESR